MMSDRSVELTPLATLDVQDIVRVSERAWGPEQARTYLESTHAAFERIGMFPDLGTGRDDIYRGLRSTTVGSHILFYEIHPDHVLVVRILHQRMDVRSELGG